MNSALEEIRNENVLSACSLFGNLPKPEEALGAEERHHILNLLVKIMFNLNEIPWESISLPIFKHWCDLLSFVNTLLRIIKSDNSSKIVMIVLKSVTVKVFRFFFRGMIHFKMMNIKIVDNAQKSESSVDPFKEKFLMLVTKRIKNYETIQDLIDGSPTAECPVCRDVTFTESTDFVFRLGCNHLVCLGCEAMSIKANNNT